MIRIALMLIQCKHNGIVYTWGLNTICIFVGGASPGPSWGPLSEATARIARV